MRVHVLKDRVLSQIRVKLLENKVMVISAVCHCFLSKSCVPICMWIW